MQWKIWFSDGLSSEGATQEDWISLPDDGVIGIAVRHGVDEYGRKLGEVVTGSDWYWMYQSKIYQSNTTSAIPNEWLPHNAPLDAHLKSGRWVSDEELAQCDQQILEWLS